MHLHFDELKAFATGRLSDAEAERMESHLADCQECGSRLDELDLSGDPLLSLLREKPKTGSVAAGDSFNRHGITARHPTQDVDPLQADTTDLHQFGRYQLGDEIGRGGMGVVYRAYDPALRRTVALKVINPHRILRSEDRNRFRREAESAGRLQHANIVQIFEFGEDSGRLYCAFEFVDGQNLAERLEQGPFRPAEAAEIASVLADAVEHAHRRQVVHRDLKPANVLFTPDGTPKIADFGLAKLLDDEVLQTVDGTLLGSPCYMAPEQATGRLSAVGPSVDVYALGAVLYEMLTGHTPFRGDSIMATLDQVKHREPVPPSRLRPMLDRDLDTICLKCLAKSPKDRYANAAELASDLRRFLDGVPILARRAGWFYRTVKLVKRHPVASSFVGLFFVMLAAFAITISHYSIQLRHSLNEATQRYDLLRRNAYSLQLHRAKVLAKTDPQQACRLLEDQDLCPADLRDFYWVYLHALCQQQQGTWNSGREVRCLAVCPQANVFAAGDEAGVVRIVALRDFRLIRELRRHAAVVTEVAFSADGKILASCSEDGYAIAGTWEEAGPSTSIGAGQGRINGLALSANGRYLATAHSDKIVRVWTLATGELVRELSGHDDSVFRVSFSADGMYLASASRDETMRVWNTATWNSLTVEGDKNGYVTTVRFHPKNSRLLITAGADHAVRQWTINDQGIVQTTQTWFDFPDYISNVAFTENGDGLALASYDGKTEIRESATGQLMKRILQPDAKVLSVAFDPENRLLTGSQEGQVQCWNPAVQDGERIIPAHSRSISTLSFVTDTKIVSTDQAGNIRLWNALDGSEIDNDFSAQWMPQNPIAWSSNRQFIAWQDLNAVVHIAQFREPTRLSLRTIPNFGVLANSLALTQSSNSLVMADYSGAVHVIDMTNGQSRWHWSAAETSQLTASPTSLVAFVGENGAQAYIADTIAGTKVLLAEFQSPIRCFTFSPDGASLAIATSDGSLSIYELSSRRLTTRLRGGRIKAITCIVYAPDGNTLASNCDEDEEIVLWDPTAGTERGRLAKAGKVQTITFSPNGHLLAVGYNDGRLHVWKASIETTTR